MRSSAFAISFNMPCVSALAATARETHSVRWTAKIGVFYTLGALLVACCLSHRAADLLMPDHQSKYGHLLPENFQKTFEIFRQIRYNTHTVCGVSA